MRLPKSFNDITIAQFQVCYFLLGTNPDIDCWVRVISCLSGFSVKQLEELPISKLKTLIHQLKFLLNDEKLNTKVKKYIVVGRKPYKAVYKVQDLNTPQTLDLKTFLKPIEGISYKDTVVENAHKLLACIYLPFSIKGFKYQDRKHEQISKEFLNAKVGDVYGTLFFYSRNWENWINYLENSGKEAIQTLTEHMKEVEEWMKKEGIEIDGAGK